MSQRKRTKCYIEEYEVARGHEGARLRGTRTGRNVDLGFAGRANAEHFMTILAAADQQRAVLPEKFSKECENDYVSVTSDVVFDARDEIRYLHSEALQH